ncbi:hypothetical protein [Yaniella halotolerans]|uniref:hypothetical protein n=1 Tax=Yaniella halotolerans TaxID=225453 RepID=UPI0003B6B692|nr:hypothetical protein [Yaniella halotolerans]
MFRKLLRLVALPVVFGLLFLTACGPGESTGESCLRFEVLRVELEAFENNPPSDPEERFQTAEAIAGGFDIIRDSTRNPELAEGADALSELYWTALQVQYDNVLFGPDQIIAEVVDQVGVERAESANLTYERICGAF